MAHRWSKKTKDKVIDILVEWEYYHQFTLKKRYEEARIQGDGMAMPVMIQNKDQIREGYEIFRKQIKESTLPYFIGYKDTSLFNSWYKKRQRKLKLEKLFDLPIS